MNLIGKKKASASENTKKKKKTEAMSLWYKILIGALLSVCIIGGIGLGWAYSVLQDLPDLNPNLLANPAAASTIYDKNGEVLLSMFLEEDYRLPVEFNEISPWVKKAIVVSEDKGFYDHNGINVKGTIRAITSLGKAGGGSSITQQLARNVYLTLDVSLARKLREMALALQLEKLYSKDEILGYYLNQIFFGHWAQGVQAGAQMYFGKDAKDLNLAESAMLVAIIPSPNTYSPYIDFEISTYMQHLMLDLMVEEGAITLEESEEAKLFEISLVGLDVARTASFTSNYFADYVLDQLPELLTPYYGSQEIAEKAITSFGLEIHTTLDPVAQASVEKAIHDQLEKYQDRNEDGQYDRQAAAVVIQPETGYIVALAGGREYPENTTGAWNRATDSLRQPGSSIKPLIDYAPGIAARYITAATVFDDVPTVYPTYSGEPWKPTNFDDAYFGLINVREALARSQNIPAIKTMELVGVDECISFARNLGLTSIGEEDRNLSAAIGGLTYGVSPLDMTVAYATFANQGVRTNPVVVTKVVDKYGVTIYENRPYKTIVFDEQTAYVMTDLLKTVVSLPYGTGRLARIGERPVAAKSGTTDDFYDLWFCGYTKDYAATVWIGHDQVKEMYDLYGTGIAPKVWQQFMAELHEGLPIRDWEAPKNIEFVEVCRLSGLRPSTTCPADTRVYEIFITGTAPALTEVCSTHVLAEIDTRNGQLATLDTPSVYIAQQLFIRRPKPLPDPLPYGNPPPDAKYEIPKVFSSLGSDNPAPPPTTP